MAVIERFIPADQIDGQPTPQELFILLISFYAAGGPSAQNGARDAKLAAIEKLHEADEEIRAAVQSREELNKHEERLNAKVKGNFEVRKGIEVTKFVLEHYRLRGQDSCMECGAAVAHGYCRITRTNGEKAPYEAASNGNKRTKYRERIIATHFPYQGFHILGSHDAVEGRMEKAGLVVIDPTALQNFFSHPLWHLRRESGEPGGAFYPTFRFVSPHEQSNSRRA